MTVFLGAWRAGRSDIATINHCTAELLLITLYTYNYDATQYYRFGLTMRLACAVQEPKHKYAAILCIMLGIIMCLNTITAAPTSPRTPLPVSELSARYRNWSYYEGPYEGFVVPPLAGNFSGQSLTDTAVVFEKTPEDKLPDALGKYRMSYLFFNSRLPSAPVPTSYAFCHTSNLFSRQHCSDPGYETALATSDDLLHWSFNKGGDNGIIFKRNSVPGTYDYGGVTFGGLHFASSHLRAPRQLAKTRGRYHVLYGCYPSRTGYEAGNGGEGVAYSSDGVSWERVSSTLPILTGGALEMPRCHAG